MNRRPVYAFLAMILLMTGLAIRASQQEAQPYLTPEKYRSLQKYEVEYLGTRGVPVERVLWTSGIYPVTHLSTEDSYIEWYRAAYCSRWFIPVLVDEDLHVFAWGEKIGNGNISVSAMPRPRHSIMDVAPTAAGALGLDMGDIDGKRLTDARASKVIVLYVDGMGWHRYHWASKNGVTKNISSLGDPLIASSVYPSISVVNSAAMTTGLPPEQNGVDAWDNRTLAARTNIEIANDMGISAAWIDGRKPPISMDNGIINANGSSNISATDMEVIDRTISEYRNGTRLIYAHMSFTDKIMHYTGPYSSESLEAIAHADELTGKVLENVEPGTMVILLADHGGHDIKGGEGDHGSLLPQDMLIPIFIKKF